MKTQVLFFGLLALVEEVYSHYVFSRLIVNHTNTPDWKYVRNINAIMPDQGEMGKWMPIYDVTSPNITCNRDAGSGPKTSTATVIAGDEVGFKPQGVVGDAGSGIYHPGPGQVYMSRAPNDDVEHYDGKGDWFKIAYAGASSDTTWKLYDQPSMNFTIPKTTPPGKYLLRIEHIFPHDKINETQNFVSCAQINVVGPGGGKPTDFVKFPGSYSPTDPGILVTQAQFLEKDLLKYKAPGPAVWQG